MKTAKAFRHALNMVLHSKLRSWLTILGIVIGVAAVIAIVSIGEGLESLHRPRKTLQTATLNRLNMQTSFASFVSTSIVDHVGHFFDIGDPIQDQFRMTCIARLDVDVPNAQQRLHGALFVINVVDINQFNTIELAKKDAFSML